VATGARDGQICLWDASTGRRRAAWRAGRGLVSGLAFSRDGRRVVDEISYPPNLFFRHKKTDQAQSQVWDVRTHRLRWSCPSNGLEGGAALSPDGRLLAVSCPVTYYGRPHRSGRRVTREAHVGGGVRVWDWAARRPVRTLRLKTKAFYLPGEANGDVEFDLPDKVNGLRFSPDGRMLAGSAEWDGNCGSVCRLQRWCLPSGRRAHLGPMTEEEDKAAQCPAFPARGGALGAVHWDQVWLWDARTGEPRRVLEAGERRSEFLSSLAFSPDGRRVAAGVEYNPWLKVWDARTGRRLCRIPTRGDVTSVAFSPDSRTLAAGSGDGWLEIWPVRRVTAAAPRSASSPSRRGGRG